MELLYFGKWNFLVSGLKSSYNFSKKSFSCISGVNFLSLKNKNCLCFPISNNSLVFTHKFIHLIFFIQIFFVQLFSLESLESLNHQNEYFF